MNALRLILSLLVLAPLAACLASAPPHPEAARLNRLAVSLLSQDRPGEAEMALEVALEYNPCLADALHNLALIAYLRADLDQAERLAEEALTCRPDLVQSINLLRAVDRRRGRLRDAARFFARALEADPGCLDARRNLILVSEQLGERETAAEERGRLRALSAEDALSGGTGD